MLFGDYIYDAIIFTIISHLPNAFVFLTIILNNIIFGYILISDCFSKENDEYNFKIY